MFPDVRSAVMNFDIYTDYSESNKVGKFEVRVAVRTIAIIPVVVNYVWAKAGHMGLENSQRFETEYEVIKFAF